MISKKEKYTYIGSGGFLVKSNLIESMYGVKLMEIYREKIEKLGK